MSDSEKMCARKSPCSSCPYRRSVASGIWDESEYAKLEAYDRETMSQPPGIFLCHHADGQVCAGWIAHAEPGRLLAVRLGLLTGRLDDSVLDYSTDVPLFSSGCEAAEHGRLEIERPGRRARRAMENIAALQRAIDEATA